MEVVKLLKLLLTGTHTELSRQNKNEIVIKVSENIASTGNAKPTSPFSMQLSIGAVNGNSVPVHKK